MKILSKNKATSVAVVKFLKEMSQTLELGFTKSI